jgi:hypothetical protein
VKASASLLKKEAKNFCSGGGVTGVFRLKSPRVGNERWAFFLLFLAVALPAWANDMRRSIISTGSMRQHHMEQHRQRTHRTMPRQFAEA